MRATSAFSLEAGTSTFGWRAEIALRTRVSMSAMGSLVIFLLLGARFSPTRLGHAWNLAVQGELAEAQAANAELAQERARTAAAPATVAVPAWELGSLMLRARQHACRFQLNVFGNLGGGGHSILRSPLLLPERHSHLLQQRQALRIGAGRGGDGNVHTLGFLNLGVVDFRENQLVLDAQRVVAAAIEGFARNTAEVAHAGQRHVHQAVEKFVHAVAAQRHHASDRLALAQLELRDGFRRLGHDRLLAGDGRQLIHRAIHQLGVLSGFAQTDVDRNLVDPGHGHHILVAEFFGQRRGHRFLEQLFQTCCHVFLLSVERLSALAANPGPPALAAGHMIDMVRNAHGLVAARANDQDVGRLNRALALRDAALDLLGRVGTRVALDHHYVLHQQLARLPVDRQTAAGLSLVAAGDDFDRVFLLEIHANRLGRLPLCNRHQITSGASETIFMNFFSRSSLATGPNTRVPTGSPTSLINTAAFESNRM